MTLQKLTVSVLFLLLVFTAGAGVAQACGSGDEYYIHVDADVVENWLNQSGLSGGTSTESCNMFIWYAIESPYSMSRVSESLAPCQMESFNDLQWQFYVIMIYTQCWQY